MKPLMEAKAPLEERGYKEKPIRKDRGITRQDLAKALKKVKSKEFKTKLSKTISSKGVLKSSKASVTISNNKPAEYVPVYFQAELKEAKRSMFFE